MDNESKLIAKVMKDRTRTIAVDLDGTLASQAEGWKGFQFIGKPIMSVVKYIRREKKMGAVIVLHTCRVTTLDNKINAQSLDAIRAWLKKHRVPVDEIWMSVGKPYATYYVDEKAVNPDCHSCMEKMRGQARG